MESKRLELIAQLAVIINFSIEDKYITVIPMERLIRMSAYINNCESTMSEADG